MSADGDLFRAFFESADDAILVVEQGRVSDCNVSAHAMLGVEKGELLGQILDRLSLPVQPAASKKSIMERIEGALAGRVQRFEWVGRRTDGEALHALVVMKRIQVKGRILLYVSLHDTTERARKEQSLREQVRVVRQWLAPIVGASHDAVVIADLKGSIQFVNPAFAQMTGYSRSEVLGKNPRILQSGLHPDEYYADLWQAIVSGRVWEGELTNRRRDGTLYQAQSTISPVRNARGEVEQFVAVQRDVTAQKRVESALTESRAQLADSERERERLYERRAEQVRTSVGISEELVSVSMPDELFRRVVATIKERFGYYHVQIFRYRPAQHAIVLMAADGEVGERMLAEGYSLSMGHGVVGTAAATGRPVLVPDISESLEGMSIAYLDQAKGELAVPIMFRGEVLGVLDVQSDVAGALDRDDQFLLESLCGPIAMAIEDLHLRQEMEARLRQLNTLQRLLTRQGWNAFRSQHKAVSGFTYDQRTVRPAAGDEPDIVNSSRTRVSVPIDVGGEVVGMLGVYEEPDHALSARERELLRSISDQVTEALQKARLLEQTQSRAGNERVIRDIADKMQQATDVESLMRVVAEEVNRVLHASRVYVRMGTESDLASDRASE